MKIIYDKQGQPDPYIIRANDKFYIYATGITGVTCYRADKIDGEWENLGVVLETEGEKEFWAPCVIELGDTYYMYYSSVKSDSRDAHDECIKVAVCDRPDGKFSYVCDVLPPFSIDPHVVVSGGELYMFYSLNDYSSDRIGTYIAVAKMASPLAVTGESVAVVRPTVDEEIFMKNRFGDGRNWHTIEGAFYFRDGDAHYLIYSGNCYRNEYYFLGYASAVTPETDLTKINFVKRPSPDEYLPLIAKNAFESGTGHCSVIKIDGKYYCVYHGRDGVTDEKGIENRTARVCELVADNGTLTAKRYKDKI